VTTAATIFVLSGTYILLALGWVIIFRATQIMNFATGEFMVLGAYIFYLFLVIRHLNTVLSAVLALLLAAVFGAGCYVLLLRRMVTQPLFSAVVVTLGLSTIASGMIDIIAGPNDITLPSSLANATISLPGGARVSVEGVATTGVALVVVALLMLFYRFSSLGVQMRAAAESPALAARSGMNVALIFGLSWAIAGVITAIAGITYGYTNELTPQASQLGLDGIAPALIGGFVSIGGTVPGAIIIATVQTLGVTYLGGASSDAVAFAVLLLFIMVKPSGLFGGSRVRSV
jgi:branched-chain amino acid transport system permease protein